jgi:hypothetical protein
VAHECQHEEDSADFPQSTREVTLNPTQVDIEEQEIEEEEADLASYGEEPGDDAGFEELEEETQAAGGELPGSVPGEIAPGLVSGGELAANGEAVPEVVLEAEEREAEELELEEAQAEAEALLEAEAIGDGTVDASAEVRGPAPEARLLQRTQRRGPERGGSDRTSDIDRRGTARGAAFSQSREHGGAADQRTAQGRAGSADPDCEGADREEKGRASPVTSRCRDASWSSCRR